MSFVLYLCIICKSVRNNLSTGLVYMKRSYLFFFLHASNNTFHSRHSTFKSNGVTRWKNGQQIFINRTSIKICFVSWILQHYTPQFIYFILHVLYIFLYCTHFFFCNFKYLKKFQDQLKRCFSRTCSLKDEHCSRVYILSVYLCSAK